MDNRGNQVTKRQYKLVAGFVGAASVLGAYLLQPGVITLFADPPLVGAIVGGVMAMLTFVANWLPSITGTTAGDNR